MMEVQYATEGDFTARWEITDIQKKQKKIHRYHQLQQEFVPARHFSLQKLPSFHTQAPELLGATTLGFSCYDHQIFVFPFFRMR